MVQICTVEFLYAVVEEGERERREEGERERRGEGEEGREKGRNTCRAL